MKYEEIISTQELDWQNQAQQLAQERKPFVVVGWKYAFDNKVCESFAKQHSYNYRFDPDKGRAFLILNETWVF